MSLWVSIVPFHGCPSFVDLVGGLGQACSASTTCGRCLGGYAHFKSHKRCQVSPSVGCKARLVELFYHSPPILYWKKSLLILPPVPLHQLLAVAMRLTPIERE